MPQASQATRHSAEAKIAAIVHAVSRLDLTQFPVWQALERLSTHTSLDGVEADPAGIDLNGDKFNGILTAYVGLRYGNGSGSDDGLETSDSFGATFEGHFKKSQSVIDDVSVDTSAFYE
jgi:hypothetical protein